MVGQADWFNHMARDIPFADVMRAKHEQGIEMAAIGYRYTLEELGQAMMLPGTNLTIERAAAARRVHGAAVNGAVANAWISAFDFSRCLCGRQKAKLDVHPVISSSLYWLWSHPHLLLAELSQGAEPI